MNMVTADDKGTSERICAAWDHVVRSSNLCKDFAIFHRPQILNGGNSAYEWTKEVMQMTWEGWGAWQNFTCLQMPK